MAPALYPSLPAPSRSSLVSKSDTQLTSVKIFTFDLFDLFIDDIDRKPTTIKSYRSHIDLFKAWLYENGITQPVRKDIKDYREFLKSRSLASDTRSQYLRTITQFFKWAFVEGYYDNISDKIRGEKVDRSFHKKDALQREDVAAIAATIDRTTENGKRLYAMFLLCVICGLRTIEIHRADVGDIKTLGGTVYIYLQGKGHDDKDAPVLLIPEVKAAIDDYLNCREAKATARSPLFTSTSNRSKGERIATTTISTMLKEMLIKAGYDSDRLTAHSLRHTSGTGARKAAKAFDLDLDLYDLQHLMRHCDPATTEIYIHDDDHERTEEKGRTAIYNYYFGDGTESVIIPELEKEIKALSIEEQNELLAQIRARKGGQA